jgi:hypothetical protein
VPDAGRDRVCSDAPLRWPPLSSIITSMTTKTAPLWQFSRRRRPKTARCARCKSKIKIKGRGRVPKFCSPTCRQLSYQQRKWQKPTALALLADDIATVKVRAFIRAEIWSALQAAGLVAPNQPPPSLYPKRQPRRHLRLVEQSGLSDKPRELE